MVVSETEYLIVAMAAFILFFVATLFKGSFSINAARTFVGAFSAEVTSFP